MSSKKEKEARCDEKEVSFLPPMASDMATS